MRAKGYLFCALAAFGWGSVYVTNKILLEVAPAAFFMMARYLLTVLLLWAMYGRTPRPRIAKEDRGALIFAGALGYGLAIYLLAAGCRYVDASLASVITCCSPVLVLLMAVPLLHEKIRLTKVLGLALTVLGAVIVVGRGYDLISPLGVAMEVAGIALWSLATIYIRRLCSRYDANWITLYTQGIAAMSYLPLALGEGLYFGISGPVGGEHLLAFLWAVVGGTALANLFWGKGMALVDANSGSLFYAVMPATSALLGILLLGEEISGHFVLGTLVLLLGLAVALLGEWYRERNEGERLPS